MIVGKVIAQETEDNSTRLEPQITINIAGVDRVFQPENVIVDTGFTGALTLPESTIAQLGLTRYGRRPAIQASGERRMFEIYGALVSWHDNLRPVFVYLSESRPLLGMALISGSRLIVDAWEGGDVVVEEVPQRNSPPRINH